MECLLRCDLPEGGESQHDLAQVDAGSLLFRIVGIRHEMLLCDEKIFLHLNARCGVVLQLAFLMLHILLIVQHSHVLVIILRIREIEVGHVEATLRTKRVIMRIFYAKQIEQEGKDNFALRITGRAVKIGVFLDDFADAEFLCMAKTGEAIADVATILEGKLFILRFEFLQTCLQLLTCFIQRKIVRLLGSLDFGLLSALRRGILYI